MRILIHICCANCAVYPVKILREEGHSFTGFWSNSNIHPFDEYKLRLDSLRGFTANRDMDMIYDEYEPAEFFKMFGNFFEQDLNHLNYLNDLDKLNNLNKLNELNELNNIPAYPERCKLCYSLRLGKTAEKAAKYGFDAFTTTLMISPYQDFEKLTAAGKYFEEKYNVSFYLKDFRLYFAKSMTASKELGIYRQKYCGCIFSRAERHNKLSLQESKY
ncbi:MAG: epoxyqueuosine reductase QueH [Nitrospirae bacterium]|nr:epoxyqueuosine reductase QueH [Nitrospirota bacterium]